MKIEKRVHDNICDIFYGKGNEKYAGNLYESKTGKWLFDQRLLETIHDITKQKKENIPIGFKSYKLAIEYVKNQFRGKPQKKHPGALCVINYKGGVGKTTVVTLLGVYLATKGKRVLLVDTDPQCSLSLALGEDPEKVSKTELTIYNFMEPGAWMELKKKNLRDYTKPLESKHLPDNLHLLPGSFDTDELDLTICKASIDNEKCLSELFLYAKQLFIRLGTDYDYILVDCPPNKMYLTQAMLQACSVYLTVTIPDRISTYGMPRLIRWVRKIESVSDRPKTLGYILNAVNRSGGGMVNSQFSQSFNLKKSFRSLMTDEERKVIGHNPCIGIIPRLDSIPKFLGGQPWVLKDFSRSKSRQPSVGDCMTAIVNTVIKRIEEYHHAKD
ncbi:MAG: Chromosome partitioning protein ParA [Verrucomicrobia subdivision 3 bacterium]|nr:Chromosome partitioning protein ParA [Limisphaerales bacterium]MCS1417372.1 Chromosome partitioning protein ParA [Limisphaerales bacterium]